MQVGDPVVGVDHRQQLLALVPRQVFVSQPRHGRCQLSVVDSPTTVFIELLEDAFKLRRLEEVGALLVLVGEGLAVRMTDDE